MAEFQRVEIPIQEDGPLSEQDVKNLEQEATPEGQEQQVDDQRPEWLPEKFSNPEDLAKAYTELQSEFTKARQSGETGDETSSETVRGDQELSIESFSTFTDEFNETGDVSEEAREKIVNEMGLPREMIDGYVEGQKALLELHFKTVYGEVGGQENYEEMTKWAAEALPEGEQDAFNAAVMDGDQDQMFFAIRSLAARWKSETGGGSPTPLVQGSTSATGATGGFRSLAELTAAMKDPRYGKDPAYRKDIETRLSNSNIL